LPPICHGRPERFESMRTSAPERPREKVSSGGEDDTVSPWTVVRCWIDKHRARTAPSDCFHRPLDFFTALGGKESSITEEKRKEK
jgi:hypothetical protein